MGIRELQWIGLTQEATDLVLGETVPVEVTTVRKYPDGREVVLRRIEHEPTTEIRNSERAVIDPFSDSDIHLLKDFVLPNGRILEEHVQAKPWSSGPVVFTALKENGEWLKETLWPEDEIEPYL
jgi:hypothetical protein